MSPTYLYSCEPCGLEDQEIFQKPDAPNPVCYVCGGPTRRLIAGGTDFILKGGGWTGKHYLGRQYSKRRGPVKTFK